MKYEDVNNSFFQAKIACNHIGSCAVTDYKDVIEYIKKTQYPFDEEEKLCKSIISGNEEDTTDCIKRIMNWIIENSNSLREIKKNINQLITVVDRTISRELNLEIVELIDFYDEIEMLNSESEIVAYFTSIIDNMCNHIKNLNNSPSEILIEKVCSYIDENYEKDINLYEICKIAGVSKFYFSKIFKQYKNKKFVDYVRDKRIEKAKEYLRDSRFSVKEITIKVGYNDPNYFSNVFKKSQGISPTEYKNKISY